MSSLSQPEPAPKPPILTNIANVSGQHIATLTRAPGSTTATLRDAQGRLRAILREEYGALSDEALWHIQRFPDDFQPNDDEDNQCNVPQRP